MAAAAQGSAPAEHLHLAVAPADVDRFRRLLLGVQSHGGGQAVAGKPGKTFSRLLGEHQGVELSVPLEGAASVDGHNVLLLTRQGVGGGHIGIVEGHRGVSHDAPPAELNAPVQEAVVFHALPGGHVLQPVLIPNPAMDKQIVGGEQDLGQGTQEAQLRLEVVQDHLPQGGQVVGGAGLKARLLAHLDQGTPVAPHVEVVVEKLRPHLGRLHKLGDQIVAVAPDAVHRPAGGQVHDVAQHRQAVRPLLHQVPQQHQDIVGAIARPVQYPLEQGQAAVDVADHQHPPSGRELQPLYPGFSCHGDHLTLYGN